MNPFDLTGPAFLAFYAVLSALLLLVVHALRRRAEDGEPPTLDLSNPYLIAYLRGGRTETIALALASLVDRGLLRALGDSVTVASRDSRHVQSALERAVVARCGEWAKPAELVRDKAFLSRECGELELRLKTLGLLPDGEAASYRRRLLLGAIMMLGGVAFTKVGVALQRGHHNVGFLVILTLLAAGIAYRVTHPFRTRRGDRVLADLRTLFSALRDRVDGIARGGATAELALVASVFGIAVLPESLFPERMMLYPKSDASSASGSSCGSSGCGGGSCGGGGCGGGCGGCGS